MEAAPVVASAAPLIASDEGRRQLGGFLITGLCRLYQGDYNPHYLTGLGSTLWVLGRYWNRPEIAFRALRQYLEFYFAELRAKDR